MHPSATNSAPPHFPRWGFSFFWLLVVGRILERRTGSVHEPGRLAQRFINDTVKLARKSADNAIVWNILGYDRFDPSTSQAHIAALQVAGRGTSPVSRMLQRHWIRACAVFDALCHRELRAARPSAARDDC